jgi:SAM-dependent methyltransferase
MPGTAGDDYAQRLQERESAWWKRLLDVQAPYRWNLRRQRLGRTLDVGCGIGRNLATLDPGSIGVDHNKASVRVARSRGYVALDLDEWVASDQRVEGTFDALLLAHVVEHMTHDEAVEVVRSYLPYLRSGGVVYFICPQERGYASDPTHVTFTDGNALMALSRELGLEPEPWRSFPFPRWTGKAFLYNEFNVRARRP